MTVKLLTVIGWIVWQKMFSHSVNVQDKYPAALAKEQSIFFYLRLKEEKRKQPYAELDF